MQLLFLSALIGGMFYLSNRAKQNKRPGDEQEPELLKGLKALLDKLPGLSEEDKILGQDKGTFYSTADFDYVWERVVDDFKRFPVMNDPKYSWRKVQDDKPYHRMILDADWSDKQKWVGPSAGTDRVIDYNFRLRCVLQFQELEAGGTAINFEYTFSGPDIIGERLKRGTNTRLRSICLQLTQDPTRGTPF